MSNGPDMIIAMLQQLNTKDAKDALAALDTRYTTDQIQHRQKVVTFIESVELIQAKTIKQVPALFKKG